MVLKREMKIWKELDCAGFHPIVPRSVQYIILWLGCDSLCILRTFEGESPLRTAEGNSKDIRRKEFDFVSNWFRSKMLVVIGSILCWCSFQSEFNLRIFGAVSTYQFLKHSSSKDVITRPFLTPFDSDLSGRRSQWVANLRTAPIGSLCWWI